jgi:Family of unknown function (DUF6152)
MLGADPAAKNLGEVLMAYRAVGIVCAIFCAALLAASGPAIAHHSFAMFDQANEVDLDGVVQEFRYVNPHTFIILDIKQKDGTPESWILEGVSPSALAREGWSRSSLKPGDEIQLRIAPLRSGAPGGAWLTQKIKFHDGRPIVEKP